MSIDDTTVGDQTRDALEAVEIQLVMMRDGQEDVNKTLRAIARELGRIATALENRHADE